MTVLQALLEQAQATPNAEAIIFENEVWTYKELVDKAQKIAQFLVEKGFEKDDIVKLMNHEGDLIGIGRVAFDSEEAGRMIGKHGQKALVHYDYLYLE